MKKVIGSLLFVLVLSSFVFAGTSSSSNVEFNIVDTSFKDSRVDESSKISDGVLRNAGIIVTVLLAFILFRKLFASSSPSRKSSKKRTSRKRKAVKR